MTIRVLYFLVMIAVIVAVDVLFFRNLFWIRVGLIVGIVLVVVGMPLLVVALVQG